MDAKEPEGSLRHNYSIAVRCRQTECGGIRSCFAKEGCHWSHRWVSHCSDFPSRHVEDMCTVRCCTKNVCIFFSFFFHDQQIWTYSHDLLRVKPATKQHERIHLVAHMRIIIAWGTPMLKHDWWFATQPHHQTLPHTMMREAYTGGGFSWDLVRRSWGPLWPIIVPNPGDPRILFHLAPVNY